MYLSKREQETILLFTEADHTATIATYNAQLKETLAEFSQCVPLACSLSHCTEEGRHTYRIDRRYLGICFAPLVLDDIERLLESTEPIY